MDIKAKFQACYLPILAEFAATTDVRYYLNGFYVEPAHKRVGGVYLVATNGHAVVVIHDPKGSAGAPGIYQIPKLLVGKCSPSSKKVHKAVGAEKMLHLDGRMATLTMDGFPEDDIAVGCKLIEGKYPDVRRVMNQDFSSMQPISFLSLNASYLSRLSKIAKLGGDRYGTCIQLRAADNHSVIYCCPQLADHSIVAGIMPMLDEKKGEPSFLKQYRSLIWKPDEKAPEPDVPPTDYQQAVAGAQVMTGGADE